MGIIVDIFQTFKSLHSNIHPDPDGHVAMWMFLYNTGLLHTQACSINNENDYQLELMAIKVQYFTMYIFILYKYTMKSVHKIKCGTALKVGMESSTSRKICFYSQTKVLKNYSFWYQCQNYELALMLKNSTLPYILCNSYGKEITPYPPLRRKKGWIRNPGLGGDRERESENSCLGPEGWPIIIKPLWSVCTFPQIP